MFSHNAGVVSILPLDDQLLLTGSYDNHVRLFDFRNLRRAISAVDLDGGVWRILPRPESNMGSFLTCCMQAGARVFSHEIDGVFEPNEERRLIYGASWYSRDIAALCSFYERNLYICKIS